MKLKNKVKIYTLGCKVNQYDSSSFQDRLVLSGFELVEKEADFSIINTCAVTRTAINKAQRTIALARKENPAAEVCLMGCWPKAYADDVKQTSADLVYGVGEADQLLQELQARAGTDCLTNHAQQAMFGTTDRARYTVKIQDGCEQFCSYCIIPYTRGKLQSREEPEIVAEVTRALQNGFQEIVLSGIHLGLYGVNGGTSLVSLINKLLALPGLGRIRLSSIEVSEVSPALIDLIASSDKVCNHLHIPLQSGSDKILRLMNRPYERQFYEDKIKILREKIPLIAISTDVITAFPEETNDDFAETLNFIEKLQFSKLHVFPFSAHERTPAAQMENTVTSEERQARAKALRKLGGELERKYKKKFSGQKVSIVLEHERKGQHLGKSEHYVEFNLKEGTVEPGQSLSLGRIVNLKIK